MIRRQVRDILIKNKLRRIKPLKIGPGQKMALVLTAGVTKGYSTIPKEISKIRNNLKYDVAMINDVTISSSGDIKRFQEKLVTCFAIPVKSVPGYELYLRQKEEGKKIATKEYFLSIIEEQARRGIDAMTIHPGLLREDASLIKNSKRNVRITARGGGLIYEYIKETGKENPFYQYFDDLLDLIKSYHITLSFGQSFRPGCLADRPDKLFDKEVEIHSRLAKKASKRGVGTMIEILGHLRIADLRDYMKEMRLKFPKAILTCMGPILTDISIGHDHITSAIGVTFAGLEGVDMVVNVTPDEHIGIPSSESIKKGIIAHKIACHIVDTWKINDLERDFQISKLRKYEKRCFAFRKGKQFLIDPYNKNLKRTIKECSMCGDFCPYKKKI